MSQGISDIEKQSVSDCVICHLLEMMTYSGQHGVTDRGDYTLRLNT